MPAEQPDIYLHPATWTIYGMLLVVWGLITSFSIIVNCGMSKNTNPPCCEASIDDPNCFIMDEYDTCTLTYFGYCTDFQDPAYFGLVNVIDQLRTGYLCLSILVPLIFLIYTLIFFCPKFKFKEH